MRMNLYATRNKKSGAYGKIAVEIFEEDQAKENYTNAALEADAKSAFYLEELELYHLGSYDTTTGKVQGIEPVFLLDLGAVIHGKEDK